MVGIFQNQLGDVLVPLRNETSRLSTNQNGSSDGASQRAYTVWRDYM